ncbi:hypothetical protein Tco_1504482 [Tanacetum coccineum]
MKKLKKKAKPVITHHKAWMKSVSMKHRLLGKKSLKPKWMQKESVSKQGRKLAKAKPTMHKDPAFETMDDAIDLHGNLRKLKMRGDKAMGGKKHADLKSKNFEEIQVLYKRVKRSDKDFIAIGSAEDERQIKEMNEESKDPKEKRLKKRVVNETPKEEDTAKVSAEQEVTEQSTKKRKSGHVKMIARKRPSPQPDDDSKQAISS